MASNYYILLLLYYIITPLLHTLISLQYTFCLNYLRHNYQDLCINRTLEALSVRNVGSLNMKGRPWFVQLNSSVGLSPSF